MPTKNVKQALLIMDVQPGILHRLAEKDQYLALARKAVDQAHDAAIPVIFVVVGFREGFPEVSPENAMFSALRENAGLGLINPEPAINPSPKDVVVTKRRVSAFTGSDLEVILRAGGIGHLILAGISTSGVVLSTVREASDRDYQLTVLSDLCADSDPEIHSLLINKIFPKQATVITSANWVDQRK
jgi:nicotinamidase-related amidase